jgi:hypothetical protein
MKEKDNDCGKCWNLFGMCDIVRLWFHSLDRCHIADQQLVASLLERSKLELASGHARSALLS